MAFIEVKNIRKSYQFGKNNSVEILKGVNLDIEYGEFVALVGSSGSGKSTLLYIMGLLDQANEGKVIIHGHSMLEMTSTEQTNARLKYLGYVFQDFNLIPELTITENLEIIGIADSMSVEESRSRAHECLREVGLGDQLSKLPSELSGGQQQRVSIARSIMNKPLILFADEPTANLDSKNSQEIMSLFRSLNKKFNMTIVMVTHEDDFKKQVDRVIEMKDGVVIDSQ
ncbi:MAG: ABC transporter ATP-binding protein [Nanoarchaeota archaeon]|nr:ABC transporter ATP-binding protein [Nanoarchaeota archaeon]